MYFPAVPNSFVYNSGYLCWRDVLWGYEQKLVGWEFVVETANFHVSNGSTDTLEIDLICLGRFDIQEIERGLYALAAKKISNFQCLSSQKKWLFIALKWLFENKERIADPLGEVELIYEDFGFPSEIESFIRYMPPSDSYKPEEHSLQQNSERLFYNWSSFLEEMERVLKAKA